MEKYKKETIWAFYAILILVLGLVGYYFGTKKQNAELYAVGGVVLGAVISIVLWITVGKKMAR